MPPNFVIDSARQAGIVSHMTGAAEVTSHTALNSNPFLGASLPPVREWLTTLELAKEGLYLSPILETPRLFISDVASAGASALLSQHKIGAILSLVPQPFERIIPSEVHTSPLERYRVLRSTHAPYNDPSIARYYFSLRDDGTNTPDQLIAAFELLEDICRAHSETGILVHCQAGISRSVSLVAALVAKSLKCSFEEGVQAVAKHRHVGIHEEFAESLTKALGIQLDVRA